MDLWNPKYTAHIFKVTVAVDMLGNILWICPLASCTSADVLIWDGYGPSRTRGDFFDSEVGCHDGTYKGRVHVIEPFIGRKNDNLLARQQSCNDVHGWYRAQIEHLFAHLWHWGFNSEHLAWWYQRVASIGVHFITLYLILHPEAGPLPSLWTVGKCSPLCLEEHLSNC